MLLHFSYTGGSICKDKVKALGSLAGSHPKHAVDDVSDTKTRFSYKVKMFLTVCKYKVTFLQNCKFCFQS